MAEEGGPESRVFEINWHIPESIVSRYATHMVVQNTGSEFVVSYFEIRLPIILGTEEERRQAWQTSESVDAVCVARVIISGERMPEFIRVLQGQLDEYQRHQERTHG